jgi:hypothetical protein
MTMPKPGSEDRDPKGKRKQLNTADVEKMVDSLMPHLSGEMRPRYGMLGDGERPSIFYRLRSDPDGHVSAALNTMECPYPGWVLHQTIHCVDAAFNQLHIEKHAADKAEQHTRLADRLSVLADDMEGSASIGDVAALRKMALDQDSRGQRAAAEPGKCHLSRKKVDQRAAIVGAALRMLAERIFGDKRIKHQPLCLLVGVAIGTEISENEGKQALRSRSARSVHSRARLAT